MCVCVCVCARARVRMCVCVCMCVFKEQRDNTYIMTCSGRSFRHVKTFDRLLKTPMIALMTENHHLTALKLWVVCVQGCQHGCLQMELYGQCACCDVDIPCPASFLDPSSDSANGTAAAPRCDAEMGK